MAISVDQNWGIDSNAISLRLDGSTYNPSPLALSKDRVGIGTTSPQKVLEVITPVDGFISFASHIAVNNWTGIHFGYRENNTDCRKSALVFERVDGAARGKVHILNNDDGDSNSADLSDAKVTVQSNGNIGMGTTSPGSKLALKNPAFSSPGMLTLSREQGSNDYGLTINFLGGNSATDARGYIGFGSRGSGAKSIFDSELENSMAIRSEAALHLGTNSNHIAMTIDTSQAVGIGTTAPTAGTKLEVAGKTKISSGSDAPLNLPILDNDPNTPSVGDIWIKKTGTSYFLKLNTSDGNKQIQLS